jgi:beta-phosphoglucomutase-like phosphatase (HAD superfamily)
MRQRGIRALTFDLDPILVDTTPLQYQAYRRVLVECGAAVTRDAFRRSLGDAAPRSCIGTGL